MLWAHSPNNIGNPEDSDGAHRHLCGLALSEAGAHPLPSIGFARLPGSSRRGCLWLATTDSTCRGEDG
jgi:hypothetical protein